MNLIDILIVQVPKLQLPLKSNIPPNTPILLELKKDSNLCQQFKL